MFEERLQYGYHLVFVLAALLDPYLYPYLHTIPMEERIQAEELVMKFHGASRTFGKATVGQLKAWREGNHNIPDYAFENAALTVDSVGW